MEIGFSKKGDVQVLTLKGRLARENWKVVDKHLDSLLGKGCRRLVLDLDGISDLCTAGLGALFGNMKKFRDRGGRMVLVSGEPGIRKVFQAFGGAALAGDCLFPDRASAELGLWPPPPPPPGGGAPRAPPPPGVF